MPNPSTFLVTTLRVVTHARTLRVLGAAQGIVVQRASSERREASRPCVPTRKRVGTREGPRHTMPLGVRRFIAALYGPRSGPTVPESGDESPHSKGLFSSLRRIASPGRLKALFRSEFRLSDAKRRGLAFPRAEAWEREIAPAIRSPVKIVSWPNSSPCTLPLHPQEYNQRITASGATAAAGRARCPAAALRALRNQPTEFRRPGFAPYPAVKGSPVARMRS